MLRERLERVRERIQQACQRCGRHPSSVTLIGVTKGIPAEIVQEALALGLTEVGENRVQEARAKISELGRSSQSALRIPHSIRWHLIGHLQRNKAKHAIELFDVIHSVDSLALIEELARHVEKRPRRLGVLIQVNVSGEATKFGCRPDDARGLAEAVRNVPMLNLIGLMTMAPFSDHPEASRPHFRRLRLLRDELASTFHLPSSTFQLSMGMSQDFEVAVEEGADLIRVGTAIFGERA